MSGRLSGTWFICTLSRESFKNWEICKDVSAWGIASGEKKPKLDRAKVGDHLIIYAAGKGFIAVGLVTGEMKRPQSKEEAPWSGGIYRYGALVPFRVLLELKEPLQIPFTKMVFNGTSIHTSRLQKGFSMISGEDGNFIYSEMKDFAKSSKNKH
jgi:hypothetical protein